MPTLSVAYLTVYGGPLAGIQEPEDDPEIVRAAQSHGFRYRRAVVDGEQAWVYEGLAALPRSPDAVIPRPSRRWRVRVSNGW
jgi:hypothetical protein